MKVVISQTQSVVWVPGADIRFTSGDVRAAHDEMRAAAKGKNIWVVGGGELVGKFHDARERAA